MLSKSLVLGARKAPADLRRLLASWSSMALGAWERRWPPAHVFIRRSPCGWDQSAGVVVDASGTCLQRHTKMFFFKIFLFARTSKQGKKLLHFEDLGVSDLNSSHVNVGLIHRWNSS